MIKPIFSPSWYRVAALKPRLRSHAQIHRHEYRGEIWFVLQDLSQERFLRFSPAAYSLIGLMDGRRTVEEIWQQGGEQLSDEAPTQDDVVQLLSQLYRADVLQCDVTPDAVELLDRYEQQARRQWQSKIFSFLSWRVSLFDPERFLRWALPVVRPLFGWTGFFLWLLVVLPALVLAARHWSDLTANMLDRMLLPQNLILVWLLFPLIKAIHEFGHAFATKAFGGQVHDMGIMLLVLTPVPYVDASSAIAFREKRRRIVVGAAGMIVELFVAALALYVWLNAEPGTVRTLAYNTIMIAGVSTILFNANPLLRYDGYYMLADWVEMPNLRTRANGYLGYLAERYAFGRKDVEAPPAAPGERSWFVSYSVLSFVYRTFVTVAILLFLAEKLFYLGMILALAGALAWAAVPLGKGVHFLFNSPRLRSVRVRAVTVTALAALVMVFIIGFVPMPHRTGAEGVVWIPKEAFVRAKAEGFVERVLAAPGARVRKGEPLVRLQDPLLVAEEKTLLARIALLEARRTQYLFDDRVKADTTFEELHHTQTKLRRVREQLSDLTVAAAVDGVFALPAVEDLPGRFVKKGELLGHVLEAGKVTVRTMIPQAAIDLVRHETYGVEARLAERLDQTVPARILREVPGATEKLPSKVVGLAGGGEIPVDPSDPHGLTALQKVFQFDVELTAVGKSVNVGSHSYVRFDHGWEPLGSQWYRKIRQLFLSRFHA